MMGMDQDKDLFAKAEAELASIDRQIAALQKRRVDLADFVAQGRKLFGLEQATALTNVTGELMKLAKAFTDAQQAREASMKAKVLALARQLLTEHHHATTPQIVAFIESQGVQVTGKDKNTTVSVILSRSPDFASDRARGWFLLTKNPQDAATSAGSSAA